MGAGNQQHLRAGEQKPVVLERQKPKLPLELRVRTLQLDF